MTVHPFPHRPAATHGTPAGDRPGADLPRHRATIADDLARIERISHLARRAELTGAEMDDPPSRWPWPHPEEMPYFANLRDGGNLPPPPLTRRQIMIEEATMVLAAIMVAIALFSACAYLIWGAWR